VNESNCSEVREGQAEVGKAGPAEAAVVVEHIDQTLEPPGLPEEPAQ
jgi:hypothetical protein